MRSVTFLDRLTLEVTGAIAQNGVCLGDVNGDGDHELVVGNDAGDLLVSRVQVERFGGNVQTWASSQQWGWGNLLNCGHNVVVVVSGCGWVNIFDFSDDVGDTESMTSQPACAHAEDPCQCQGPYHL